MPVVESGWWRHCHPSLFPDLGKPIKGNSKSVVMADQKNKSHIQKPTQKIQEKKSQEKKGQEKKGQEKKGQENATENS
jgi:hypothetical protein